MLNHEDQDDYIPTFRDHTWGDLLDRIAAGISHELAYSAQVIQEEHLQPFAQHVAELTQELLGDAWENYCNHAHGTG